jgi:hypothetical protein
MLYVSDHGCCPTVRVHVVLLDSKIAPDCEQCGGGSVIANGSNVVNGRDCLVRHSLGTHIPCTGLPIMSISATNSVTHALSTDSANLRVKVDSPFGVLHDAPVLRPGEPGWSWLSLVFLVEDSDHTGHVTAMRHFGHAPYSQVTIQGLGGQHLGFLLR